MQSSYYFSSATGNDTNPGTVNLPLKTWTEFLRRIGVLAGFVPFLAIRVDCFIIDDLIDELYIPKFSRGSLGEFHVWGSKKTVHSGTLSANTPRNPATNQFDEYQDGSFDWTPYLGSHLVSVDISDAINGPVEGFVIKPLTGPNRARMNITNQVMAADPFNPQWVAPGAGKPYNIQQLPKVTAFRVAVPTEFGGLDTTGYPFSINYLDFTPCALAAGYSVVNFGGQFRSCIFGFTAAYVGQSSNFDNCVFRDGISFVGFIGGSFSVVLNAFMTAQMAQGSMFGWILQGSQLYGSQIAGIGFLLANHHGSYGLGVADVAAPLTIGPACELVNESRVYGSGLTDCCFEIFNGGKVSTYDDYATVFFVATGGGGGYSDVKINKQTSLPAMDPATYTLTAPRTLTFAHLNATVAAGGFQGSMFDPRDPHTAITPGSHI